MNAEFVGLGFDYTIPQDQALTLHLAGLFGNDKPGYAEIRAITSDGKVAARRFVISSDREAIAAAVGELKSSANVYVGAVVRMEQCGKASACGDSRVLWTDGDTPESVDRIMAACPSWVIETSPGKVQAFWAIRELLAPQFVRQANLRLAAHLGADTNACDVARILRVPGTFNFKHDPPEPVRMVAMVIEAVPPTARDLVGHLPDPLPKTKAPAKVRPIDKNDALASIPASVYVPVLTGRELNSGGYVQCPWHGGGNERTPSLKCWADADRGFACFAGCASGDIFTFAAKLWDLDSRRDFPKIKARLLDELIAAGKGAAA